MKRFVSTLLVVMSAVIGLTVAEAVQGPQQLTAGGDHHWCC
jgi:hypothetical protein